MIDHHEVAFVEAGVENTGQDRLVIRKELLFLLRLLFGLRILTSLRVLFLDNLDKSADIGVV